MNNSRLKNCIVVAILLTSITAFGSYADIYCEQDSAGHYSILTKILGEGCVVLDYPITNSQGTVYSGDGYSIISCIGKSGFSCSIDPNITALDFKIDSIVHNNSRIENDDENDNDNDSDQVEESVVEKKSKQNNKKPQRSAKQNRSDENEVVISEVNVEENQNNKNQGKKRFNQKQKNKQNQKVNTEGVENNNDDAVVSEKVNDTQKSDSKNRTIKLRNHKKQKNQRKNFSDNVEKNEEKQVVVDENVTTSKEQLIEGKNDSDNVKPEKKSRNRNNAQHKKGKEKPVDIVTSEVKEAQRKRVLNLEGLSVERGLMAPPSELQIQIDSINQLTELSELTDKRKEEMMYSVISPTLREDKAKKRGWWQKLLKKPEDNKGEK